jgi:hypothetical protein
LGVCFKKKIAVWQWWSNRDFTNRLTMLRFYQIHFEITIFKLHVLKTDA